MQEMQWHNVTDTVIQKLLDNGSEAIQYQVTLALEVFNPQEKTRQQHKLIRSENVQKLLEAGKKLVQKSAANTIHRGNHNFLEYTSNVIGSRC